MTENKPIANVIALRYASAAMRDIWSEHGRIVLEREFWIAVLKAQSDLGIDIPPGVIEAYEKAKDHVDLDSIAAREAISRHDVKARIEEFSALAGYEHIHKGMTSRDLTDNVEQYQILRSLHLVQTKLIKWKRANLETRSIHCPSTLIWTIWISSSLQATPRSQDHSELPSR